MKKVILLATALSFTLIGCRQDDLFEGLEGEGRKISYTIEQGTHNAKPLEYQRVKGIKKFSVEAVIKKGIYDLENSDQQDWNKLTGFSDCNNYTAFKGKGAMIGWRWNVEKKYFEFAAFVHKDGSNKFEATPFEVTAGEEELLSFDIEVNGGQYIFTMNNGQKITMPRGCSGVPITGRLVSPYFGGNQKAPTEIYIDIIYKK